MITSRSLLLRQNRILARTCSGTAEQIPTEEITIPVPWGHIAGKWWGPKNVRPILLLHGFQVVLIFLKPIKIVIILCHYLNHVLEKMQ